ncbi:hypothetical protein Avbf_02622, partial [Armadillidium vulgare]
MKGFHFYSESNITHLFSVVGKYSSEKMFRNCILLVVLVVCSLYLAEGLPYGGGGYSKGGASAKGGFVAGGGSVDAGHSYGPGQGSAGYSKGGVDAQGGFVAAGGSASAGGSKGYNR